MFVLIFLLIIISDNDRISDDDTIVYCVCKNIGSAYICDGVYLDYIECS